LGGGKRGVPVFAGVERFENSKSGVKSAGTVPEVF
jgi:hypothetical protein